MTPLIVGIAGGSCSGKTTYIRKTQKMLGSATCAVLYQDDYYIDQSQHFDRDGGSVNFDHPNALDFALLGDHLKKLKQGFSIATPVYDFATHSRLDRSNPFPCRPLILIDGILILSQPNIIQYLDLAIFIECTQDLRLQRRVARDVRERGRNKEGVIEQFHNHVAPMHELFVEPSKNHAHYVLTQDDVSACLQEKKNLICEWYARQKLP